MSVEILAERFVRDGRGAWLDLATGDAVDVMLESWSDRGPHGARELPAASPGPHVIDCGRVGVSGWFEARLRGPQSSEQLVPVDALDEIAGRVATAVATPHTGLRLVRASPPAPGSERALARNIAARLRRLGTVPVRTDLELDSAAVAALLQRHLALFCYDDSGKSAAIEWIRRLNTTLLRGHVIVDLRTRGQRERSLADAVRATDRVRERRPAYASEACGVSSGAGTSELQIDRGLAYARRGRHAAGTRWLRAAMESGRRRGDDEAQARAGRQLVQQLLERGDLDGARRESLRLLRQVQSWYARVDAAEIAVRVLTAIGELSRADGLLSSIAAETSMLGQPLPPVLRLRLMQTRFWQGRFEEAAVAIDPESADPEMKLWRALVGWARGDDGLSHVADLLPDVVRAGTISPELACACEVEALLSAGHRTEALERLTTFPHRGAARGLGQALLEWLRASCAVSDAHRSVAATSAREFIHRTGARGLTRWGLGRSGMHLLHAIPALLNVVQDAEDDLAMLTRGLSWIRGHAGASAAALLSHDGGRIIAASAFAIADLNDELVRDAIRSERPRAVAMGGVVVVTSPVQLNGATIGLMLARGTDVIAGTLAEAARVVASLCGPALRARLDAIAQAESGQALGSEILGSSPAMQALRESIARAAATSFPVLIEGESGTGKELVARAVHRLSARRDRRFCPINCAAISDELVEAELFGHTRGAFTGAVGPRAGLFEDAHGGTLFLDEVIELSPRAQAKLLRVLQEREIRRVGENVARPVDIRLVAATNRPLDESVHEGRFRDDLRFRIAVVKFRLPPLRERLEDVPLLATAFWRKTTSEVGKHVTLGPDAVVALCRHAWPGNIRELQNAIAALAVIAPSRGRVQSRHVAQVLSSVHELSAPAGVPLDAARKALERQMVTAALARHAGRRADAARELGLSRQGLTKAIKRLGVDAPPETEGAFVS